MKRETQDLFQTSETTYKSKARNIPEDFHIQQYRCENSTMYTLPNYHKLLTKSGTVKGPIFLSIYNISVLKLFETKKHTIKMFLSWKHIFWAKSVKRISHPINP